MQHHATAVSAVRHYDLRHLDSPCANKVLLVLNNENCIGVEMLYKYWEACPVRICADGAANWLARSTKLFPTMICGDLDSISLQTREHFASVEFHHDADQDTNDMEKCLERILNLDGCEEILVLGAFGGRFDHEMANIHGALRKHQQSSKHRIFLLSQGNLGLVLSQANVLHLPTPENGGGGMVCGLVPLFGPVLVERTRGLKYNVLRKEMRFGGLISTSNETMGETIEVDLTKQDDAVFFTLAL